MYEVSNTGNKQNSKLQFEIQKLSLFIQTKNKGKIYVRYVYEFISIRNNLLSIIGKLFNCCFDDLNDS